jgi:H+/Cl- antiporter ClcA
MNFHNFKVFVHKKALSRETGFLGRTFRWLDSLSSDYANIQAVGLWAAAILTGIVATLYAQSFRFIEEIYAQIYAQNKLEIVSVAPVLFLGAWWLVHRYAPAASGSGIPQIMAAIESSHLESRDRFVSRLLSLRTAVVKVLSSLMCLAGGGAIGREGPTLQISGAIFHFIGSKVRRYYPDSDEQTWVIAGAAAGLASAFNTPLGGIVYAIEELGAKYFHRIRTALITAVIISGVVAQTFLGSYLYLGYPQLRPIVPKLWPIILLTGFISGLLGGMFSKGLLWLTRKRKKIRQTWKLALCTVFCGVIASILIYFVPLAQGPGTHVVSDILFKGETSPFTLLMARVIGTSIAYLSGAAGGIFSPSLTIGACIGSKVAYIFGSEHVNLLAMLGMIGFLTGVTHTPFTSFILVIEMSDRHSAVFPMMVAAVVAYSAAKSIDKLSFYESVRDDLFKSHEVSS